MKKVPVLLSANDYLRIQKALSEQKPDSFVITYAGEYLLKVTVSPLGKETDVWGQPFVITVYQEHRNVASMQHFKSVEQMKRLFWPV